MAKRKHVRLLEQGVIVWNRWRKENPEITPDLTSAFLNGMDLSGTDLVRADLRFARLAEVSLNGADLESAYLGGVNLRGACLAEARLSGAYLAGSDLRNADLSGANLSEGILGHIDLSGAKLRFADLQGADLHRAKLIDADLCAANLRDANLRSAILRDTNLANAILHATSFADNDLLYTRGLEEVLHHGPSTIGIDTLVKSKGQIPEVFLRGCGLSDWQIETAKLYDPALTNEEINNVWYRIHDLRVRQAIQISPLFISYSHADGAFVDAIEMRLTKQGIRFWRDVHHAVAGRLERQIDQAIRLNDAVLLVLSEQSTSSDWVEHEVRKAREKEKRTGKDALCPVALDASWKTCRWPERLREQVQEYNILDFSRWQDEADFQRMFGKLLEGLNLFYK